MPTVVAGAVTAFVYMLGVNTHIDFSGVNLTNLETDMNYVGLKNVRDDPHTTADITTNWPAFAAATGSYFEAFPGEGSQAVMAGDFANAVTAAATPGLISAIEGGNEEDDAFAVSAGNSIAAAKAFQINTVYPQVNAIGLKAVCLSFGAGFVAQNNFHGDYDKVNDMSPWCDFANAHTYPVVGHPTGRDIRYLDYLAHIAAPGRPLIISELGWADSSYSAYDKARFMMEGIFDAWIDGAKKVFIYSLIDDVSGTYGIMNTDTSPKVSGNMIHHLTQLFQDSGQYERTDMFTYTQTTSGPLADTVLVFEKTSQSMYAVIWNEGGISHSNTLSFPITYSTINVWDPVNSATAIATTANANSVTVTIFDRPLIVELIP